MISQWGMFIILPKPLIYVKYEMIYTLSYDSALGEFYRNIVEMGC